MSLFPIAPDFRKVNVDQDPVRFVEVGWDVMTDSQLRSDYLESNDLSRLSASTGQNPGHIMAHMRTVEGYQIYRGEDEGFSPNPSNLLVDESVLTKLVGSFIDYDVSYEQNVFYKLCLVINE